jgi:hypothetical protein
VQIQQPQGQLQTEYSVDTSNYIMGKHNIKSKTNYRQALEKKRVNAESKQTTNEAIIIVIIPIKIKLLFRGHRSKLYIFTVVMSLCGKRNYIHTYVHIYIHTYMHTYIHTYIHTYMHTCIPTYIHTYIHTCCVF